mmetsp:Transcript_21199/g.63287  ORF Transcript_21199/g.63287 Transcript_21199/m.63287 type:complete len:372 (-) Transcript_21199:483-1598(-)
MHDAEAADFRRSRGPGLREERGREAHLRGRGAGQRPARRDEAARPRRGGGAPHPGARERAARRLPAAPAGRAGLLAGEDREGEAPAAPGQPGRRDHRAHDVERGPRRVLREDGGGRARGRRLREPQASAGGPASAADRRHDDHGGHRGGRAADADPSGLPHLGVDLPQDPAQALLRGLDPVLALRGPPLRERHRLVHRDAALGRGQRLGPLLGPAAVAPLRGGAPRGELRAAPALARAQGLQGPHRAPGALRRGRVRADDRRGRDGHLRPYHARRAGRGLRLRLRPGPLPAGAPEHHVAQLRHGLRHGPGARDRLLQPLRERRGQAELGHGERRPGAEGDAPPRGRGGGLHQLRAAHEPHALPDLRLHDAL